MAKKSQSTATAWTDDEVARLRKLAKDYTPTRVIGLKLGRTENSVRSKAKTLGLSLKPVNAPYGRVAS